eukprot:4364776-Prymnesium_polylepis.2
MSGSPRLNSTTFEARGYWHREALRRTRCGDGGSSSAATARCLLSLNASELLAAMPDDWSTDGWGFSVFASSYRYAPLLLVDGRGGVLPTDYLTAYRRRERASAPTAAAAAAAAAPVASVSRLDVPTIIGVTRQEGDFSPGSDVRNLTEGQFADFVRAA